MNGGFLYKAEQTEIVIPFHPPKGPFQKGIPGFYYIVRHGRDDGRAVGTPEGFIGFPPSCRAPS